MICVRQSPETWFTGSFTRVNTPRFFFLKTGPPGPPWTQTDTPGHALFVDEHAEDRSLR